MSATIRASVLQLLEEAQHGALPSIVQAGHPALRAQSEPWDGQLESTELNTLIELMRRVMHAAPGVGLAAPQLGIPLQLAVLEDQHAVPEEVRIAREREPLEFFAVLNPRYLPSGDSRSSFFEGCLSMTGWQAVVPRYRSVELSFFDPDGIAQRREFTGWSARIVQHETDHLAGTLYIDKAELRSLADNHQYAARWAQPGIESAREALGF
ncbi:peptide deformylase [Psychromicrobium lacuslunae]|uniref:Peptide deformylase n=1 Tax=Psychromicrobium lacuslunae TaxID=1618207 RepID=A0A0D4BX99_9MICC|nr:peptide deformylase [Psychromicrobium lacuslunae]AJT40948.1 peptide deformylase [Psychromicrobium lacuslunae]